MADMYTYTISGFQTTIAYQTHIATLHITHLSTLHKLGETHCHLATLLPHHCPKVLHCDLGGCLCCNVVLRVLVRALIGGKGFNKYCIHI